MLREADAERLSLIAAVDRARAKGLAERIWNGQCATDKGRCLTHGCADDYGHERWREGR